MPYQASFPNGVVNALSRHETIDFTGFFGIFQHPAVANKEYLIIPFLLIYEHFFF